MKGKLYQKGTWNIRNEERATEMVDTVDYFFPLEFKYVRHLKVKAKALSSEVFNKCRGNI